jgi:hypothetical protein
LLFSGIPDQGVLIVQPQPAIFEEYEIRRVYDETTETWWFSIVDIVQVLSAGIVLTKGTREDLRSTINESLIWGGGLFLSYSAAILAFEVVLAA